MYKLVELSGGVCGIPIASSGFDANMLLKQMGSIGDGGGGGGAADADAATEEYA